MLDSAMNEDEFAKRLQKLYGVGAKVAEISLYTPNMLQRAGIAVVVALGLTACAEGAPEADISPADRFIYDYVDSDPDGWGGDCLYGTAYDLAAGNYGRASVTPPSAVYDKEKDILTITPISGQNPLRVEGFGQVEHRVSPVGPEDQAVFDSYGCETKGY
jgi:hypothetical protein